MTRAVLVGLLTCLAASLPPVGAPVPAARVSTLFQLGVEVVDIASRSWTSRVQFRVCVCSYTETDTLPRVFSVGTQA